MVNEIKKANTIVDIHPMLTNRWSPRAFDDKSIDWNLLEKIFEAARWAPSSSNEQPWRFFIGRKNDETWEKIFECLDDGNRNWCKNAPVLVIGIAKMLRKERPNKHYAHDLGQSFAHLTFQAMSMDIYVHQMAGFYPETAREKFNIPEGFEPFTCAALGYLGYAEMLDEKNRLSELSPRIRKDPSELFYKDTWGNSLNFKEE